MRFPFRDLPIEWSEEKNRQLMRTRGVSFEEVQQIIEGNQVIDVIPHWNPKKYPNQFALVVVLQEYAHIVPFVRDDKKVFLKTIYPSRKANEKYLSDLS